MLSRSPKTRPSGRVTAGLAWELAFTSWASIDQQINDMPTALLMSWRMPGVERIAGNAASGPRATRAA